MPPSKKRPPAPDRVARLERALAREQAKSARLHDALGEARERAAASAEILRVIARSPSDVQPVFDAIARTAVRLVGHQGCIVTRIHGDQLHLVAAAQTDPNPEVAALVRGYFPVSLHQHKAVFEAVRTAQPVLVRDTERDPRYSAGQQVARAGGYRTVVYVPMLRDGAVVGVIHVTSARARSITAEHVRLLEAFADQAVIAIENVRLFNELDARNRDVTEALDRQTATAEVLRVIGAAITDTQPVFEAIARACHRLFHGDNVLVGLAIDGMIVGQAGVLGSGAMVNLQDVPSFPIDRSSGAGVCVLDRRILNLPDLTHVVDELPRMKDIALRLGYRAGLWVPLLRGPEAIGVLAIFRHATGAFADAEVALAQTFADQAVIAIENVRLFNETKEALDRQTATAEILKVISGSPTEVQPVFDAIAQSAARLFNCTAGIVVREGTTIDFVAGARGPADLRGPEPTTEQVIQAIKRAYPLPLDAEHSTAALVIRTCQAVEIPDTEAPEVLAVTRTVARASGRRSVNVFPLVRDGVGIGAISVSFAEAGVRLTDKQRALVHTFADQAVIAIENVRLFRELEARNRDVTEALDRQTATAEVLRVISGAITDTRPVFEAIARACQRLFHGDSAFVGLAVDGMLVGAGVLESGAVLDSQNVPPIPIDRGSASGLCVLDRRTLNLPDLTEVVDELPRMKDLGLRLGYRSGLWVPLLRGAEAIGVLTILRRTTGAFADAEVALAQTFADQAVIAIENVRLFNELEARNRDVTEALDRQTATAEVLRVISGAITDTQPVFEAIARASHRLFHGDSVVVGLAIDGMIVGQAGVLDSGAMLNLQDLPPWPIDRDSASGVCVLDRRTLNLPDLTEVADELPRMKDLGLRFGHKSGLWVPLLRGAETIGLLAIMRRITGAFADAEVALAQTFADQAVIAIENARLFNETKEALDRQTTTAEILKVISGSPTDVQPVFDAIAQSAARLFTCDVYILVREGSMIDFVAWARRPTDPLGPISEQLLQEIKKAFPIPIDAEQSIAARVIQTCQVVEIPDIEAPDVHAITRTVGRTTGLRSSTVFPLVRDGVGIGAIAVSFAEAGVRLTDKQRALLQTFADQAVIAIENVRLFRELEGRNRDLREALDQQTATAEILRVISSSPTDAQPVFDTIATNARRLLGGFSSVVLRLAGDEVHLAAYTATSAAGDEALKRLFPVSVRSDIPAAHAIRDRALYVVTDSETDARVDVEVVRAQGWRSALFVPMLREATALGAVAVTRREPGPFTDEEIALLKVFADQAVIAIENVRLFRELQARTEALSRSVGQLTALGEVSQAISSTLDLEEVLRTIVSRAVQLTGLDGGAIYEYDDGQQAFILRGGENIRQEIADLSRTQPIRMGDGFIGRAAATRAPVQVPDLRDVPSRMRARDVLLEIGARALLAVPLVREDHVLGALAVIRNAPGEFPVEVIGLLETFATQSAIAIQNARLFREIEDKGRQLEQASRHKSQFLASMSHELRTPLNAILGLNEMLLGEVYGEVPEDMKPPLAQTQASGRHLLGLINNVLDLAKIEANRLDLALGPYVVQDLLGSVRATLAPLAAEKGLELTASAPDDLPVAHGDAGRLTQCLINLAGNAVKFTKEGRVDIRVEPVEDRLRFSVTDTGIGIAPEKMADLFTEFKQTDATIAREYGGTGLGLAITKKFVELHKGSIRVESEPGRGSTFIFEIPLRVPA